LFITATDIVLVVSTGYFSFMATKTLIEIALKSRAQGK